MMHHHHTLNGTVYHDHPGAFHDANGQHHDKPEWGPAHHSHDHPGDRPTQGRSEATPHSWTVGSPQMRDIRTEYWPYP
jgi:hypothetical protein